MHARTHARTHDRTYTWTYLSRHNLTLSGNISPLFIFPPPPFLFYEFWRKPLMYLEIRISLSPPCSRCSGKSIWESFIKRPVGAVMDAFSRRGKIIPHNENSLFLFVWVCLSLLEFASWVWLTLFELVWIWYMTQHVLRVAPALVHLHSTYTCTYLQRG